MLWLGRARPSCGHPSEGRAAGDLASLPLVSGLTGTVWVDRYS